MRILILGAGATGGYFGGKLAASGGDVTFLVRERRAADLSRNGLRIESPNGNVQTPVKTVTQEALRTDYDAIILSCKAYDLVSAIDAIRQGVGPSTIVLPLLNGMRQLDALDKTFGAEKILGGTCHISAALTEDGIIRHFSPFDALTLGARHPNQKEACNRLFSTLQSGGFETRLSENVIGAMWEKWVLLATLAGMTCMMRATIGEIVATQNGAMQISAMLDECCAIAKAYNYTPKPAAVELIRATLTDSTSTISSSMLRDMQRDSRIEADHIVGDLIARADAASIATPSLKIAYTHLQVYQNARQARH
ncbi:MAG: 2-dehydropantoate 2-reductase [Hyphomicrobium sp.]|nr:MAG: 2-dehydropantoate 2-reductase [Hyphomicrobium sp.]PPC99434.1 MAG: 2-dehydropantoate 2-reductase [Hyphomicrobium sp.]